MTRNVALLKGALSCALSVSLAATFLPVAYALDEAEIQRQVDEKRAEAGAHEQQLAERQATAYELQQQLEERQTVYAAALGEVDAVNADIEANERRISELEREIPKQEKRSNAAARDMYKFQQESLGVIDLLLSSGSFQDFISQLEYVNRVADAQVDEILKLNALKAEVDATQRELGTLKTEAEMRAEDARVALRATEDAQAEIQQRIAEEAQVIAEIYAMAEELAKQPRDNDQGSVAGAADGAAESSGGAGSADAGSAGSDGEGGGSSPSPTPSAAPATPDMSGDEAAFVSEWAARIDAYLSGSPLAGQGTTFARAAYKYGVDPRLSPAISFTESGKGAACFLSHNAWGWGSSSWGSWEEAIEAHVSGLARGYGGKLTLEGARKYCPPNWQAWYDRTLGQMNLI